MILLTERPVELDTVLASVHQPAHGGLASFVGFVRDHQHGRVVTRLEYSAYGPMAQAEMARIAAEAAARWAATVSVVHRVGTLQVGDVAVAVAVSTPHRAEAFDACRYVIEELKRRVPIWKREYFGDGSVEWVDPTRPGPGPGTAPNVATHAERSDAPGRDADGTT